MPPNIWDRSLPKSRKTTTIIDVNISPFRNGKNLLPRRQYWTNEQESTTKPIRLSEVSFGGQEFSCFPVTAPLKNISEAVIYWGHIRVSVPPTKTLALK